MVGLAGAATTTLNTGDTLTGSVGTENSLNLTGLGTAAAPGAIVTTSNIPTINFRGVGATNAATDDLNLLLMSGVTAVNSNNSISDLNVNNALIGATYGLGNTVSLAAGANADLTVTYAAGQFAGTDTTMLLAVENAGIGGAAAANSVITLGNAATGSAATAIENVALEAAGSNFVTLTLNTDVANISATGDGTNEVTLTNGAVANTMTVDFSETTGTNVINIGTNLSTGDSILGGSGTDTLRAATSGIVATGVSVTGVETLRLDSGAAASTVAFAAPLGLTTLRLDAGTVGGENLITKSLIGLGGFSTLNFAGTGTAATVGNAFAFNAVTSSGGFTGSADTLAVNFTNGGRTATNATPYTTGAINVGAVETFNVTVSDTSANTTTNIGALTSSSVSTIDVNGNGIVTVTAVNNVSAGAGTNSISNIDFSGVTASAANQSSITLGNNNALAASSVITAGSGGLALVLGGVEAATDIITFVGGASADSFNGTGVLFAGNLIATTGAGVDTIVTGAAATSQITAGTGADVITLGAGVDRLIYANGNTDSAATVAANTTRTGDFVTAFTSGTDDIQVAAVGGLTFTPGATVNINTVAAGAVATFAALAADAGVAAVAASTAGTVQVMDITLAAGALSAALGTTRILVVNDGNAGLQATDMMVVLDATSSAAVVAGDFVIA